MRRSRLHPHAFRLLRLTGAVTVLLFVAMAFTPLAAALDRTLALEPRLEPAGVIVVLGGGGIRDDGTLSDISLRRALHGIMLFRRGLAPLIVFSGSVVPGQPSESEVRAALARSLGIPAAAVSVATARTTYEEGRNITRALRETGIRRVLLVADAQGMRRASRVFERLGIDVLPAPANDVSRGGDAGAETRLRLARQVLIELIALAYYRAAGYL